MKYNSTYTKIFSAYSNLKQALITDLLNEAKGKTKILTDDERKTIKDTTQFLEQALDMLKPYTHMTLVSKNDLITVYKYELGE